MNRDIVDNVFAQSSVVYPTTASAKYSDSVDAKDEYGVAFIFDPRDDSAAQALPAHTFDDYDEIQFTIQESDDNVTFADIDTDKYMPTSGDYTPVADREVLNPSSGLQKIGVRDCKRYLRVKFTASTMNSISNDNLAVIVSAVSEKYVKPTT